MIDRLIVATNKPANHGSGNDGAMGFPALNHGRRMDQETVDISTTEMPRLTLGVVIRRLATEYSVQSNGILGEFSNGLTFLLAASDIGEPSWVGPVFSLPRPWSMRSGSRCLEY